MTIQLKMYKKTVFTLLLTLVMTLAMAIPASAASESIQFLNADGSVSSHATSFIDGGVADVTGSAGNYTVTIKLKNFYPPFPLIPVSYDFLKVDLNGAPTGDGTYEVNASKSVVGSYTYFTFSGVANLTDNLPIQLQVTAAGFHNTVYTLFIDWI